MSTTTAAAATSGLSGTLVLGIGVVICAGVAFCIWQANRQKGTEQTLPNKPKSGESKEDRQRRYAHYKSSVERAIRNQNWEYLEESKQTGMTDFPDLITMINEALKNKPRV
ncbi:MAG: hypothetical protein K2O85_00365 [Helicobacter sp.]|nr:hypothetical protein [Helicobacter sp.]